MQTVTLFSDFICPYCYLGEVAAAPVLESLGLDLDWRPYEIHPEIPAEGIPRERLDAAGLGSLWARVEALAAELAIPIGRPPGLPSSRLALEGAELARREGRLGPYRERVFRAFFVEGRDIGDSRVLADLAEGAGLAPATFEEEIRAGRYREDLARHREAAEDLLVSGVPTFFLHGIPVVGVQPPAELRTLFSRILARRAAKEARGPA
jgi:predicted DsbA family dithiol-disulfide isomerase